MGGLELFPCESGRVYYCRAGKDIDTSLGLVRIFPGFMYDRDTLVPNLPDPDPPLAHDFLYRHRITQAGRILTRKECDQVYRELSSRSDSRLRRLSAPWRYYGLRLGVPLLDGLKLAASIITRRPARRSWGPPRPIPAKHLHLYELAPFNSNLRDA